VNERRIAPRVPVLQSGSIVLESLEVPCTVRNLSTTGACLVVQTTLGIPIQFLLMMTNRKPQACKVQWRSDTVLGIRFQ
jgi:PilZ domain